MSANTAEMFFDEIAERVAERLLPHMGGAPQSVLPEADVMKMLGVKDKGSMRELRERGLIGHRVNYRSWVYLAEDVENFVRSCNEW